MTRAAVFIATVGYIGYAPIAPGTFGSAAGVALFLLLRATEIPWIEPPVIVLLFIAGTWAGNVAERYFGGIDPGPVVIDEVLGMLITLMFVPVTWAGVLLGFLVFRVLDVFKPWPARQMENLHGGIGVMADDAMAGVYGNLIMWFAVWYGPTWLT
ncbi:MAG: phosphatidylglycerophosphatase A [Acidobacteriota bacterium]|nr:phosphatidylglycerophosphatase A [Acidobacteriota bacterium]